MQKYNDFDLDLSRVAKTGNPGDEVDWKSKSFCTPGCITGLLQTCFLQTITCNCHFGK